MIEDNFDTSFVARLAQREKQNQQSYRPIIGVHKWFARRPGALFRALLLSEFAANESLNTGYFRSHDLGPLVVGDPFMGGGTPLIEASRLGCHVVGTDINPMAYWIVRQELADLDLQAFRRASEQVTRRVESRLGHLYETTCTLCGNEHASVKYFVWIKEQPCERCGQAVALFTSYVLAKNQRHPQYVLVCPHCLALNERPSLDGPLGDCEACGGSLRVHEPGGRNRAQCLACGHVNRYPRASDGPPSHRLFALEYDCPHCAPHHAGRFFKSPDERDHGRVADAEQLLEGSPQDWIPTEAIPAGDETRRLFRWGYRFYRQLFNARQLLGLETLASEIAQVGNQSVRHALLTVFSDILRYQNMLCRYDSYALKVLDIFSVHGFPVSVMQCESSLLGIPGVGSGGFRHFVVKYAAAKRYGQRPFEKSLGSKRPVHLSGERICATFVDYLPAACGPRSAWLEARPASELDLPAGSLDAVLTDPPYFANVQYAELMDFCYVWLKRHLEGTILAFRAPSTRSAHELTVNVTEERGIEHFSRGLSQVFSRFAYALKPGSPFAFTYHHNDAEAYLPVALALLDAGLTCTWTPPCPSEMGASIHINGTRSSVVDTVFVCRRTGTISRADFEPAQEALMRCVRRDVAALEAAGHTASGGDIRCIILGHMVRLAIWQLRAAWDKNAGIALKLDRVR
ncbi:MAG: DUF1156 domain-containing protein, partial [Anaerolineae bacterium]|nr:DUF1156 domain-containing protein [Anaerolineae bacterium]